MMMFFATINDIPELTMFIVLLAAILAFEIAMIVDAAQNQSLTQNQKALWIAGMLLIHPIVAIIYFFTARKTGSQ